MPKPPALLCLPALLLLGGCLNQEPYERPGTWRATGANDANLRAMVANPGDLERGVAPIAPARGETAALAAGRLGARPGGGGDAGGGGGAGGGLRATPPPAWQLPSLQGGASGRR